MDMKSISTFIQTNELLHIALILVAVYLFVTYYKKEGLDNTTSDPAAPASLTLAAPSNQQEPISPAVVAPKAPVQPDDLLPKYDDATDFAKQNPVSKLLQEQNFLISGYHVGINTVSQSNKIPYHDLRSAPPIPKQTVSPWLQSSYEEPAGGSRRKFELD